MVSDHAKKVVQAAIEELRQRGIPVATDGADPRAEEERAERARQRGKDCDEWIVAYLRRMYQHLNLTESQLDSLVNESAAVDLGVKLWQGLDHNPQSWEKAKIPSLSQGSELPKDFWSKIIPPRGLKFGESQRKLRWKMA